MDIVYSDSSRSASQDDEILEVKTLFVENNDTRAPSDACLVAVSKAGILTHIVTAQSRFSLELL